MHEKQKKKQSVWLPASHGGALTPLLFGCRFCA